MGTNEDGTIKKKAEVTSEIVIKDEIYDSNTDRLVIYDNKVNMSIEGLSAKNADIFMSAAYKLKNKGGDEIEVGYRELMNISKFRHMSIDEFHKYLVDNKKEFIAITLWDTRNEEESVDGINIFQRFSANKSKKRIILKVNPDVSNTFTKLSKNFTEIDLWVFTSLRSKYSKTLYRHLCQFRNRKTKSGWWEIPLEDGVSKEQPIGFRTLFDIPPNYENKKIIPCIIRPAVEDLSPYMEIVVTAKKRAVKGNPLYGFRFEFVEKEKDFLPDKSSKRGRKKKEESVDGQMSIEDLRSPAEKERDEQIKELCKFKGINKSSATTILKIASKQEIDFQQVKELIVRSCNNPGVENPGAYVVSILKVMKENDIPVQAIGNSVVKVAQNKGSKNKFKNFTSRTDKMNDEDKQRYEVLVEKLLLNTITEEELEEFNDIQGRASIR